jgi:hypothetical protein
MQISRSALLLASSLAAAAGCGASGKGQGNGSTPIALPRVYPPVRASTPSALIADPAYAAEVSESSSALSMAGAMATDAQPEPETFAAAGAGINLATAVQERLYTMGPTEILRILSEVDGRTSTLDTRASQHPCLTTTPVSRTYALPGGQTFTVKLQCREEFGGPGSVGGGWLAFGFDAALEGDGDGGATDDGGVASDGGALGTEGGGNSFYLIEGQSGGMGSAYHFDRTTGNVEGWIAVADSSVPTGSQVLMHMATDKAAGTFELALAGSGVGFCSAHLKTGAGFLFIDGKTNAPPPPGSPMTGQYCDATRTGCFQTTALDTDLGGDAPGCAAIGRSSFGIATDLDASSDPGANVVPATIYTTFNLEPIEVPAF